jgi:hypothetical protein
MRNKPAGDPKRGSAFSLNLLLSMRSLKLKPFRRCPRLHAVLHSLAACLVDDPAVNPVRQPLLTGASSLCSRVPNRQRIAARSALYLYGPKAEPPTPPLSAAASARPFARRNACRTPPFPVHGMSRWLLSPA